MVIRDRPTAQESRGDVATSIVAARTKAGVTQVELAKRMGTTQTAIARLESGRVAPNTSTLQRFADAIKYRLVISFQKTSAPDHKIKSQKGLLR
jgi:ribosome-binding protein aMBF1 (putative translation factor)